jgi:8-hydroxy-5-deazaflavin:NADPH oxidoreductase
MKIGILGSGVVGQQLALGFRKSGHDVVIATRAPEKLREWAAGPGSGIRVVAPADAAAHGEIIVIATKWSGTEEAIRAAGTERLAGKIVIDVTNPLVFGAEGKPPALALGYPDSAGATVQKWLPRARVVKCFNIINAQFMAEPALATAEPDMFLAGNDATAKQTVGDIAAAWGWAVHDIGGIDMSYVLEAFAMLWIVYGFRNGHWGHIFKLMNKK